MNLTKWFMGTAITASVFCGAAAPSFAGYGDVNGDGRVDLTDARLILSYAQGTRLGGNADLRIKRYGDIDPVLSTTTFGDGVVTLQDGVRAVRRAAGLETDQPMIDYWPLDAPSLTDPNPLHPPVDAYTYLDQFAAPYTATVPTTYSYHSPLDNQDYTVRSFKQSNGTGYDIFKDASNDLYLLGSSTIIAGHLLSLTFTPPIPMLYQKDVALGPTGGGDYTHRAYEAYVTADSPQIGAGHPTYYDVNVMGYNAPPVPADGGLPFDDTVEVRVGLGVTPSATNQFYAQQSYFFWFAPYVGPIQEGRAPLTWSAAPDPGREILQAQTVTVHGVNYPSL